MDPGYIQPAGAGKQPNRPDLSSVHCDLCSQPFLFMFVFFFSLICNTTFPRLFSHPALCVPLLSLVYSSRLGGAVFPVRKNFFVWSSRDVGARR